MLEVFQRDVRRRNVECWLLCAMFCSLQSTVYSLCQVPKAYRSWLTLVTKQGLNRLEATIANCQFIARSKIYNNFGGATLLRYCYGWCAQRQGRLCRSHLRHLRRNYVLWQGYEGQKWSVSMLRVQINCRRQPWRTETIRDEICQGIRLVLMHWWGAFTRVG